jgi:hypothetical protein
MTASGGVPTLTSKGGQLSSSPEPAVTLDFIEHRGTGPDRALETVPALLKNAYSTSSAMAEPPLSNLNILEQVGENRRLVRKIIGLEPNAQGELLLEFLPATH